MSDFFNLLKNNSNGISYEDLSNYYSTLKEKINTSKESISNEDLKNLNLISCIFETPEYTSNEQKHQKELINKKLFDALAGKDEKLSYNELVDLKNKDYNQKAKSFPNKIEFYGAEKHILSKVDILKFQGEVLGWRNPSLENTNEYNSMAYFDNDNNCISDDELNKKASEQLEELQKLDIKFKDKNGKIVDLQKVLKTFKDEGYTFRLLDKDEQDKTFISGSFDCNLSVKEIAFNPKEIDLTPQKGEDKNDKVSNNFIDFFVHELMHFWDMHENYGNDPYKFVDRRKVLQQESYAEYSSTSALAVYTEISEKEKFKDYDDFEKTFLLPYIKK